MKIFCITGFPGGDLDMVAQVLAQAGVQSPQAPRSNESLNIATWHQQVLAANTDDDGNHLAVQQPGRLWEQVASSIFLENLQIQFWGWADTRSTWLLDFWREFDPNLHFVLVYTSPRRALAQALSQGLSQTQISASMTQWQNHQQEILRFHHRHPHRSLLIDAEQCENTPAALIQTCANNWKLKLNAPATISVNGGELDPIACYFAEQIRLAQPQLHGLQHEMEATVRKLDGKKAEAIVLNDAVNRYSSMASQLRQMHQAQIQLQEQVTSLELSNREWQNKHTLQQQEISQQQVKLQEIQSDLHQSQQQNQALQEQGTNLQAALVMQNSRNEAQQQQLLLQSEQLQEQDTQLHNLHEQHHVRQQQAQHQAEQSQNEIAELQKNLAQHQKKQQEVQHALAEAQSNNEILLLQLHRTQEDLEQLALQVAEKSTQLSAQLDSARESESRFNQKIAEQAKQLGTVKAELDVATGKNTMLRKEVAARQQSIAELTQKLAANEKLLPTLRQELESAKLQCEQLKKEKTEQAGKVSLSQEQIIQFERQITDTQQDNQLLLLQLHQVQEEMEHHFLNWQTVQQTNLQWQQRWQRMLARTPDYCDYENLQIIAITAEDAGLRWQWRVTQLNAAGRVLPQFQFATIQQGDNLTLELQRDGEASLARWPIGHDNILQFGNRSTTPLSVLEQLSCSDWDLLLVLAKLTQTAVLGETLPLASAVTLPEDFTVAPFQLGIESLLQQLQNTPTTVLRFDHVSMKREQVNSDYEHLWMRLENLSLSSVRYPHFEFRLSCANVRPQRFGEHPKLEFPKGAGEIPFETWFDESFDDFGEKLELRFALPDAMDMKVWQSLSAHDRQFIQALIQSLPVLLTTLKQNGYSLARSWQQWIDMAANMRQILAERTLIPPVYAAPITTVTSVAPIYPTAINPALTILTAEALADVLPMTMMQSETPDSGQLATASTKKTATRPKTRLGK